jgi:hypothetical protein
MTEPDDNDKPKFKYPIVSLLIMALCIGIIVFAVFVK